MHVSLQKRFKTCLELDSICSRPWFILPHICSPKAQIKRANWEALNCQELISHLKRDRWSITLLYRSSKSQQEWWGRSWPAGSMLLNLWFISIAISPALDWCPGKIPLPGSSSHWGSHLGDESSLAAHIAHISLSVVSRASRRGHRTLKASLASFRASSQRKERITLPRFSRRKH